MPDDIQQRILDAAANSFRLRGYTGTSINVICKAACVSPATLYRYFTDKKALFDATGVKENTQNPRRQEILDAALEVFSRRGYHGATMAEIATAAGLSRATLYAQFPTKEILLGELLKENPVIKHIQHMSQRSDRGEVENGTLFEELNKLALEFLQMFMDNRRLALYRLIIAEGSHHVPLRRAFHQMQTNGVQFFSRFLADRLPDLDDPEFAARLFVGNLIGFIVTQHFVPGTELSTYPIEMIAYRATQGFLFGVQNSCKK